MSELPSLQADVSIANLNNEINNLKQELLEKDDQVQLWNSRYNQEHERGLNLDLLIIKLNRQLKAASHQGV